MKYSQKLPKKVEKQLDTYIERIKAIKWFQPSANLKKENIEKQVSFALEGFGLKSSVEYKKLQTPTDWDAARDAAAWDAARGAAAWDAAWDAARDAAAWDAARDAAAWDAARGAAAWGAARDAAWGANDVLALNLDEYKKKYPKGNFINLIPLWEMGLYPVGIVNGKFVIYVPASKMEFPKELF